MFLFLVSTGCLAVVIFALGVISVLKASALTMRLFGYLMTLVLLLQASKYLLFHQFSL
jgi:hypothetical protein